HALVQFQRGVGQCRGKSDVDATVVEAASKVGDGGHDRRHADLGGHLRLCGVVFHHGDRLAGQFANRINGAILDEQEGGTHRRYANHFVLASAQLAVDARVTGRQYCNCLLDVLVGRQRANRVEAADILVECTGTDTGDGGGVTLAGFQVFRGDLLVGVDLQVEVDTPVQGGGLVVGHDVIGVAGGADDVEHAQGALVGCVSIYRAHSQGQGGHQSEYFCVAHNVRILQVIQKSVPGQGPGCYHNRSSMLTVGVLRASSQKVPRPPSGVRLPVASVQALSEMVCTMV